MTINPPRGRRSDYLFYGVATLVGVLLLWFVFTVSVIGIAQRSNPWLALRLGGYDAGALANVAQRLATPDATPALLDEATDLSRTAIRMDGTSVDAFNAMAAVAALRGNDEEAARLYRHANLISKRRAETEIWLASYALRRGEMEPALRHIDAAMAVRPSTRGLMIPALVQAMGAPETFVPLAERLRQAPICGGAFFRIAVRTPPDLARLSLLFDQTRDAGVAIDKPIEKDLVARLVDRKLYAVAAHQYERTTQTALAPGLRNVVSARTNAVPPFDWDFSARGEDSSGTAASPDGANRLVLHFSQGAGSKAPLLRQLTLQPPGPHEFTARVYLERLERTDAPRWTISCADSDTVLATISGSGATDRWTPLSGRFVVPATGCTAQWVRLEAAAGTLRPAASGYYDDVRIAPVRR